MKEKRLISYEKRDFIAKYFERTGLAAPDSLGLARFILPSRAAVSSRFPSLSELSSTASEAKSISSPGRAGVLLPSESSSPSPGLRTAGPC